MAVFSDFRYSPTLLDNPTAQIAGLSVARLLVRSQRQLNLTQTRYRVFNNYRVVVLEIERDVRAEGRTLTEHIQMLE